MARHATDAPADGYPQGAPLQAPPPAGVTLAPLPARSHVNGYTAPMGTPSQGDGFTYRHGVAL